MFIRYYNVEELQSANSERSPVDYKFYMRKVFGNGWLEHRTQVRAGALNG
jgi:hypothetical protein